MSEALRNTGISVRNLSFVLLLLLSTTALAEQPTKRVLIISAYDTNLPGFVALNRAIRSTVKDGSPGPVEFFYEAQENKRIPIDKYEQELVRYLRLKYAGEKFDLIIIVGARSLKFLSSHKTELFADTPKLFFFFDESEETALSLMPDITGIWAKADIGETVELALALHPETERVVVVLGRIDSYQFRKEQARSELQKYEGKVQIDYATDLTIDELRDTLAALPKNTVVLFIQFSMDRLGNTFSGPEALSKIAPTSSAPIYGTANTFIGAGAVGGSVLDFDVLGARTGELALRILGGERPQDIRPQRVTNLPVFDSRELRRWGISEDRLPPGSIVQFRVPSVWDQYKWYLLGIVFLILLQSAMISVLLVNRSRRKRAEEKLKRSETQLGQAQRLAHIGSWDMDLRTDTVTWSDELYRIFGLQPGTISVAGEVDRYIHPDDLELGWDTVKRAVASREPYDYFHRIIRPDGTERIARSRGSIVTDDRGDPIKIFGATQDVTELKRAEERLETTTEQLRISEERYRELFEGASDAFYVHDLTGIYTAVNRAAEKLSGYPRDAIIGRHFSDFVAREHVEKVSDKLAQKLISQTGATYIVDMITRDGRRVPVEINSNLIYENGSPVGVQGMARDISDRLAADQAIREAEQKYRDIFENAGEGIFQSTAEGQYLAANPAFARMLGYESPEELVRSLTDISTQLYVDPKRRDEFRYLLAETGTVRGFEWQALMKDGSKIWVTVNARVVPDENGAILYYEGTAQEITERKRAEEKLKLSESQLSEAQRLAHIGSWNWDVKSNTVTWSAEMYSIYGLNPDINNPAYELYLNFVHPEDREFVKAAVEESLRTAEPFSHSDRIIRPDGEVRILYSQGHVVSDERGDPTRMFGTCQDVTEEKRADEQLKTTADQLRALSASLQSAREEEGTRIAREIHDELGSALTSLRWDLESLDKIISESTDESGRSVLREKIEDMLSLTESAVGTVRRISSELRPTVLDDLGLAAAIEWQAEQFQVRTGIVCRCDCSLDDLDLSQEKTTAVFRIFQEALTNILRHARATGVEIAIKAEGGEFILTISDNGRGITEGERSDRHSLGLLGMQERAHLIGGNIRIRGRKGKGTTITVRVPIGG